MGRPWQEEGNQDQPCTEEADKPKEKAAQRHNHAGAKPREDAEQPEERSGNRGVAASLPEKKMDKEKDTATRALPASVPADAPEPEEEVPSEGAMPNGAEERAPSDETPREEAHSCTSGDYTSSCDSDHESSSKEAV
ncbi:MAG: hypothetical protein ACKPKO_24980, partial [Candidatus Fonsibacter sp.]